MNAFVSAGIVSVKEKRADRLRLNDLVLVEGVLGGVVVFTVQALELVGDDVIIKAFGGMEITTSQSNVMLVVKLEGAR